MSADLLRTAAAKMRERAERSADSPWYYREEVANLLGHAPHTYVRHSVYATDADDGRNTPYVAEANDRTDAEHIASWHPAVALTVADWLESVAAWDLCDAQMTRSFVGPCADTAKAALAVARAYLAHP